MAQVWGLHMGLQVQDSPIEGKFIAIGWSEIGNLQSIAPDREAYKAAVKRAYPDKKAGAIPVDAGTLYKFVNVVQKGDFVVYPSKFDRRIYIGSISGEYYFQPDTEFQYPNRRPVDWIENFPRGDFTQSALNEVGSFLSLFRVKSHYLEFLEAIGASTTAKISQPDFSPDIEEDTEADDETTTRSIAMQAQAARDDFIIKRLLSNLNGYQFEEFIAHLLECMGYTARATPKSGDGGVDVIAHSDILGLKPPIIKVQCKRTEASHSQAEVNQLLGTLGDGEFGLFVTLGSFSRAAKELERNRPKIRLIGGDDLIELVISHYEKLSPHYRTLLPLKSMYFPDLGPLD